MWVQDVRYDDNKGGLSAKVIMVSSAKSVRDMPVQMN
jgi:hypothetical protein